MKEKDKHGSKEYDKILKENFEAYFLPFIEEVLELKIVSTERLPDNIQTTMERETDILLKVEDDSGKIYILHIEFQTKLNNELLYRNGEYHGIIQRIHRLPIVHLVINLGGQKKPRIRTTLHDDEVFKGYTLINLFGLDYNRLLSSQIPSVVVMAILANFGETDPETAIRLISRQLKKVSKNTDDLKKYIAQLVIMARLRNLHDLSKQVIDMPVLYDIRKDSFFLQGIKEGKEEGIEVGIEKGYSDKTRQVVVAMITSQKLADEDIADLAQVSLAYIAHVRAEMAKD